MKNYDNFSRAWDGQSAAVTSLALFSAMNELQRVLFLKCELSRLLLVSMMFVSNKITNGYLETWNFSSRIQLAALTREVSSNWTIEVKFQVVLGSTPRDFEFAEDANNDG